MFDDQASDDDPGVDGGPARVRKMSRENFHASVPREMVRKAHPSIFWI